jgi:exodeoxyribonuclease-3
VLATEFDDYWLVTVYTPNAKDDLTRIPLRELWDQAFLAYIQRLAEQKPVIFCGDLNVAHNEIDLARPKPNIGKKGFTTEERAGFQAFIDAGLIDTFRALHPDRTDAYTWWSQMANARARNIGWRIDYFLTSASLRPRIVSADVHMDIMGSDHCPVSLVLDI